MTVDLPVVISRRVVCQREQIVRVESDSSDKLLIPMATTEFLSYTLIIMSQVPTGNSAHFESFVSGEFSSTFLLTYTSRISSNDKTDPSIRLELRFELGGFVLLSHFRILRVGT